MIDPGRILRALDSVGAIEAVGDEIYGPTTTSRTMVVPKLYSGVIHWYVDFLLEALSPIPVHL